jgi:CspA family cold shock protein
MSGQLTGKFKVWKADRGFGFIAVPGQKDCFAHIRDLKACGYITGDNDTPEVGATVQFDIADGPKGAHAVNVKASAAQPVAG